VSFVDAAHGWVIETAPCATKPCTSVLRTTDGGAAWKGIPAPKADLTFAWQTAGSPVESIRFANQLDGWAFGQQLWSTHNGGSSWNRVTVGGANTDIQSLETGGGRAYATTIDCNVGSGGNCSRTTQVIEASIGSDSWHTIVTLSTVAGADGYSPAILTVHGDQWWLPLASDLYHGVGTDQPTTLTNPCLAFQHQQQLPGGFGFAPNDNVHLDALCHTSNDDGGSTHVHLRPSVDSGAHWKNAGRVTTMPSDQSGIADNGAGDLLVAAYSGGSEVLRTSNDGTS
jgi:hypothetical protein